MSRTRRSLLAAMTTALAGLAVVGIAPPTQAGTTAINPSVTALQLAQAMFADPAIVTGASFVAKPPSGTPVAVADSASPLSGFPRHGATYGILTTGNATAAATANTSTGYGVDNGGLNVRGNTDFDVTILKIDFTAPTSANCLSMAYFKFLSEEFPEYVGTSYNDAFIAELDVSNWTTSGSVITAPNNFAFDPSGKPLSVNAAGATSMSAANASGTTYDGATPTVTASKTVTPGAHSLYLSIFDQGDRVFDSATFVDDVRLTAAPPGGCVSGALAPMTTTKTAHASVSAPGAQNGYTITFKNPNATAVQLSSVFDDLPAGFTYRSGSTSGLTTLNPTVSGQRLTWTGSFTVPPNGTASLNFNVNVSATGGTYYNSAGGTAPSGVTGVTNTAPILVQVGTTTKAQPAVASLDTTDGGTAYAYFLEARLTTNAGSPIAGQQLRFWAGTGSSPLVCQNTGSNVAVTGADGIATCNALVGTGVDVTLGLGYTAVFNGTTTYSGSSDNARLLSVDDNELP